MGNDVSKNNMLSDELCYSTVNPPYQYCPNSQPASLYSFPQPIYLNANKIQDGIYEIYFMDNTNIKYFLTYDQNLNLVLSKQTNPQTLFVYEFPKMYAIDGKGDKYFITDNSLILSATESNASQIYFGNFNGTIIFNLITQYLLIPIGGGLVWIDASKFTESGQWYISSGYPLSIFNDGEYQLQLNNNKCFSSSQNLYDDCDPTQENQRWVSSQPNTYSAYKNPSKSYSQVKLAQTNSTLGNASLQNIQCDESDDRCSVPKPLLPDSDYTRFIINDKIYDKNLGICYDPTNNLTPVDCHTNTVQSNDLSTDSRNKQSMMYNTCSGGLICGNPSSLVYGSMICDRSDPYAKGPYNPSDLPDCCAGKHLLPKYYTQIQNVVFLPYPDDRGIIYSNDEIYLITTQLHTADKNILNSVLPFYIKINGISDDPKSPSTFPSGLFQAISVSPQVYNGGYGVLITFSSQITFFRGSTGGQIPQGSCPDYWCDPLYVFADIVVQKGWAIDSNKCDLDWCPWSKTCATQTTVIQNYCSDRDLQGHPRINTDVNCVEWCGDQTVQGIAYEGQCGDASGKFCKDNPNHISCKCQTLDNDPNFVEMTKQMRNLNITVPPTVCWAPDCTTHSSATDPDRPLLTTEQKTDQNSCKGVIYNVCNQVIDIAKVQGNVNIDNDTFKQYCGSDIPAYEGCQKDSDCSTGQKCINSKCVIGGCKTISDCPPNQNCIGGVCVQIPSNSCNVDSDCSVGQKCVNNKCVVQGICQTNKDCLPNQSCINGICINSQGNCSIDPTICPLNTTCVAGDCVSIKCSKDMDCIDDQFCNTTTGVCQSNVCNNTNACTSSSTCIKGQCMPKECTYSGWSDWGKCIGSQKSRQQTLIDGGGQCLQTVVDTESCFEWWEILLIVIGIIFIFLVLYFVFRKKSVPIPQTQ